MSRLNVALQELAKAAGEVVAAFADLIAEAFAPLSLEQVVQCKLAYEEAERERPTWVHFATRHKKRRIRKKYHDRIMREYGAKEVKGL